MKYLLTKTAYSHDLLSEFPFELINASDKSDFSL